MHSQSSTRSTTQGKLPLVLAMGIGLVSAPVARGHSYWIKVEPAASAKSHATIRVFFNEEPMPGGADFLKYVRDLVPTSDGLPLATTMSEETLDASWAGKLPGMIDAERDFGLMTRGETTSRLLYAARAQTTVGNLDEPEKGKRLRARLVMKSAIPMVQVLFDGKPLASALIRVYPEAGEPSEVHADDQGLAMIPGVAEGRAAIRASLVVSQPGELAGKPFSETRHYATLTFLPGLSSAASLAPATALATMPAPAVNSFGGAVLGDWLYVYSGHTGMTHEYSTETTSKHFRRLNLKDRKTWEELPMERDVQGVALVSDGKAVYRIGGMTARNKPGAEADLISVADFARFDPDSRVWTALSPLPKPRSTHDAAVIGRKIYVVGGWTMMGASSRSVYCPDALVFDLDSPDSGWKSFEQPFRRRALSAAEAGGKLYVLGGLTHDFKIDRRVDIFDPSIVAWSRGPDIPELSDREGFATSCFAIGNRLYYSGLAGLIARLDGAGAQWQAVGAWALPRNTHRLLPGLDHTLLVVGGNFEGNQTDVIEAVTVDSEQPPAARRDP